MPLERCLQKLRQKLRRAGKAGDAKRADTLRHMRAVIRAAAVRHGQQADYCDAGSFHILQTAQQTGLVAAFVQIADQEKKAFWLAVR